MARRSRFRFALVLAVGALGMTAACSAPPPTQLPTTPNAAPTVFVPFTPNSGTLELPTLLPTVTNAPLPTITNVPPPTSPAAPTAAPSGSPAASPAGSPVPVTVTAGANIPTVTRAPDRILTRVPTTPAATASVTPLPAGVPPVVISALRFEPTTPKANEGPTFFATFLNRSAENQGFDVCIEIWAADNTRRPFGLSACQDTPMPPGTTPVILGGWAPRGQGECRPYRARAIARDEDDNRTPFVEANGQEVWVDFNVCP